MPICPHIFSDLLFFNPVLQYLAQKSWAMLRKIGRFSKLHSPAVTHKTNVRHIKPIKLSFLKKKPFILVSDIKERWFVKPFSPKSNFF